MITTRPVTSAAVAGNSGGLQLPTQVRTGWCLPWDYSKETWHSRIKGHFSLLVLFLLIWEMFQHQREALTEIINTGILLIVYYVHFWWEFKLLMPTSETQFFPYKNLSHSTVISRKRLPRWTVFMLGVLKFFITVLPTVSGTQWNPAINTCE